VAGLLAAYWMGLAAADSARASQDMWDIATRATRRRQVPVDDRAALIDQVALLQVQLQQVIAEREALREHCAVNHRAWLAESTSHQRTRAELDAIVNMWTPPNFGPRSHPQP